MYRRTVGKKVLRFGHEGVLYRRSFIMYDKGTQSLWIHTTGEAVKGPLKGKRLSFVPSTIMSWSRWKELHPKTTVLEGRKAHGFMGTYTLARAPNRFGLSVGEGRATKLYPIRELFDKALVHDTFRGKKIVVFFDRKNLAGAAFETGGRTFVWKDGKAIDQKGVAWDPIVGWSHTHKGQQLKPLPATMWRIDRWKGFFPDGPVYGR